MIDGVKRIERLEKMEKKLISTVEESLKRNMEFKTDLINMVEDIGFSHKNVLKKLNKFRKELEEMNALTRELLNSISSLEKNNIIINKRLEELKKQVTKRKKLVFRHV